MQLQPICLSARQNVRKFSQVVGKLFLIIVLDGLVLT